MTAEAAPGTEARAPRGDRNEPRRSPRSEREPRREQTAAEAMPAVQAFVDTLPAAPADGAEAGTGDATRRRRRRGGRGRGRDEGSADGVGTMADDNQGGEQAVDSAPAGVAVAAESASTETLRAADHEPAEPRRIEDEAEPDAKPIAAAAVAPAPAWQPAPAPAPAPAQVIEAAPPVLAPEQRAPVAVAVAAPAPAPYRLPTDSLAAMAIDAGLQWVNSDSEKIRAAQQALADEPKAAPVARQTKAHTSVDDGPLVLIETKKDLSQVRLPFDA